MTSKKGTLSGEEEFDRMFEQQMKTDDDEPEVLNLFLLVIIASKIQKVTRQPEPGSDPLEPRRLAVPLPGSEVQDPVELYKLHVKH